LPIRPLNISIIGIGHVGHHVALQLFRAGYRIHQLCSRDERALETASRCQSTLVHHVRDLDPEADVYVFCVQDDKLADAVLQLNVSGKLILHTSASMDTVPAFTDNTFGVLYPLQTFNRNTEMSFEEVPFFISAERANDLTTIREMASSMSKYVYEVKDDVRRALHVAAVFANNFSNHMYVIASEICEHNGIPFSVLSPLIERTTAQAMHRSPADVQTGPAIRNDLKTINRHLQYLHEYHKQYEEVYRQITHSIINKHKP
jgi:predicted short-subunit dehydrogenase-like oxidoreductase (DUF2520 family)